MQQGNNMKKITVKICGLDHTVDLITHAEHTLSVNSSTAMGFYEESEARIRLRNDMPLDKTMKTAFHEFVHALIQESGAHHFIADRNIEAFCEVFELALMQFFKENPNILKDLETLWKKRKIQVDK